MGKVINFYIFIIYIYSHVSLFLKGFSKTFLTLFCLSSSCTQVLHIELPTYRFSASHQSVCKGTIFTFLTKIIVNITDFHFLPHISPHYFRLLLKGHTSAFSNEQMLFRFHLLHFCISYYHPPC